MNYKINKYYIMFLGLSAVLGATLASFNIYPNNWEFWAVTAVSVISYTLGRASK